VHVNPLVTIVSLLVGAQLLGILGVLLAIPSAAAIQIILRDWWTARGSKRRKLKAPEAEADKGPTRRRARRPFVISSGERHDQT
jgi:predicted PurR-regulated permease PerM